MPSVRSAILAKTFDQAYRGDPDAVLRAQVANLDYSDYLGRLAIGRVFQGTLRHGDEVMICRVDGTMHKTKITKMYTFEGLKRVDETIVRPGDIVSGGRRGRHYASARKRSLQRH